MDPLIFWLIETVISRNAIIYESGAEKFNSLMLHSAHDTSDLIVEKRRIDERGAL